ncbi:MAG TPA: putative DNA-binding domain-containing protein [Methylococcus sp.]|nr:putative DNA-binding domain-containing protein [Methylococcus sp.]
MIEPRLSFQHLQCAFAAHLRDPARNPRPADVPPERMALYRELVYNNLENFLGTAFPVLRRILRGPRWNALVEDFLASHRCTTPYFAEIPEEFLSYLAEERAGSENDPPFLLELAHYEWVELALANHCAECPPAADFPDDWRARRFEPSPLAWPLAYHYPVHRIGGDWQPQAAPEQPTFLLVYRDPQDQVKFLETTVFTHRLLSAPDPDASAGTQLQRLAEEAGTDPFLLQEKAESVLRDLTRRGVVMWI